MKIYCLFVINEFHKMEIVVDINHHNYLYASSHLLSNFVSSRDQSACHEPFRNMDKDELLWSCALLYVPNKVLHRNIRA